MFCDIILNATMVFDETTHYIRLRTLVEPKESFLHRIRCLPLMIIHKPAHKYQQLIVKHPKLTNV